MSKRSKEREEFLGDILTTAIEGGIGYWSQVSQYQFTMNGELARSVGPIVKGHSAHAIIHEMSDFPDQDDTYGDDWSGYYFKKGMPVTVDVIAKGIAAIKRGEDGCRTTYDSDILLGDRTNDAGMIDSDAADVIVQIGLLGKLVYG